MTQNRYDVVLFDFDGTLCDTRAAVSACLVATVERCSDRTPSDREIASVIGKGRSIRDTLRALAEPHGKPGEEEDVEPLVSAYRSLYPMLGPLRSSLYPGVERLLAVIEARCAGCAVVSNKGAAAIHQTLERLGIDVFDMVVAERPDLPPKPDPSLFDRVVKVGFPAVPRDRFLMVGDTAADLAFARNAGIASCWAAYGYGDPMSCEAASPDHVMQSMDDLAALLWPQTRHDDIGGAR